MEQQTERMLKQGVSDAVGFLGGALLGYWVSEWMGWSIFTEGYGSGSVLGILAVGLGGGGGLHLARRWQRANLQDKNKG